MKKQQKHPVFRGDIYREFAQSDLGWHNGTLAKNIKAAAAVYQKTIKNHLLKIVNDDNRYALALFEKDALLFAANVNDLDGINSQIDFINKVYRTEFKQLTKIQ